MRILYECELSIEGCRGLLLASFAVSVVVAHEAHGHDVRIEGGGLVEASLHVLTIPPIVVVEHRNVHGVCRSVETCYLIDT
ncbi:MAG: hypothetical protein RL685_997 [Pseudomonadota bacterium]